MATLHASDSRRIPGRVGAEEIGLSSLKQKAHRLHFSSLQQRDQRPFWPLGLDRRAACR
jgi:hypothetical protein